MEVTVHLIDIGVGVMQDVVLLPPQKMAASDHFHREAQHAIDFAAFRIASVVAVVHDVESDEHEPLRNTESHDRGHERR